MSPKLARNRYMPSKSPHVRFSAFGGPRWYAPQRPLMTYLGRLGESPFGLPISLALRPERKAGDRSDTRGAHSGTVLVVKSATFELNGFLFDLPERTTVCPVVLCSRPLGRHDDKQNDPNRYGHKNRQGDQSAKPGQNPNQTLDQQTQNPNQGGEQRGGQQRDPQR
jgi:hypothetical protein